MVHGRAGCVWYLVTRQKDPETVTMRTVPGLQDQRIIEITKLRSTPADGWLDNSKIATDGRRVKDEALDR